MFRWIAFAAFVVETDDTPTFFAIKQSILEQMGYRVRAPTT